MNILNENLRKAQEECVIKILDRKIAVEDEMMKILRSVCAEKKVSCLDLKKSNLIETYFDMLSEEKIKKSDEFESLMTKRRIRTASGVSVISVMTKPLGCPGKCVYCPNQKNMPKSYLDNQPAAMRAVMNDFDPYEQVYARLDMLTKMGHDVSKNEVIILGGTFSAHPVRYQELFIKRIYDAFNLFASKNQEERFKKQEKKVIANNLSEAKKVNETADCRIIGLTIETRPDYVNMEEIKWLRYLGVTRVELGVQSVFDDVLGKVKRGHDVAQTKKATKLLRQAGFKIVYHIMPGLPGSDIKRDIEMFRILFSDRGFYPDHLKIYPTVVLENSEMYEWWKKGKFKPFSEEDVIKVLLESKKLVPEWVRIVRVMRDIPESSIVDGVKSSNLRQLLHNQGAICRCIRCREPKNAEILNPKFQISKYEVNGGEELFLSMESEDKKNILALARLFLPEKNDLGDLIPEIKDCALIRELHTYGVVAGIDEEGRKTQHRGMGKKLMQESEKIAKEKGYKKISVISGVGVREYYKKIGYRREGEYMVKDLV